MSELVSSPVQPGYKPRAMPESSPIAPEQSRNGRANDNYAYRKEEANGVPLQLYVDLFPREIVQQISELSSLETRKAAMDSIVHVVRSSAINELTEQSLTELVSLITTPLSDTNFKIALTAIELLDYIVLQFGPRLKNYLPFIITRHLGRTGNNKYDNKKAGMKMLMHLMKSCDPWFVMGFLVECGLSHKHASVREESLNTMIAALLTFNKAKFEIKPLIQEVVIFLADPKSCVRQACLELCSVIADELPRQQLHYLIESVCYVERDYLTKYDKLPSVSLMLGLQSRLSRQELPRLGKDGLVIHAIDVVNRRDSTYTGCDIDWILAADKSTPPPSAAETKSTTDRSQATSGSRRTVPGPLRSAGKKLPWDKEKSKVSNPPRHSTLKYQYNQQQQSTQTTPPNTNGGIRPSKSYLQIYNAKVSPANSNAAVNGATHSNASINGANPLLRGGYKPPLTLNGISENGDALSYHKRQASGEVLATTWPRTNGYVPTSTASKTSINRQISAGISDVKGPLQMPKKDSSPSRNPPSSKSICLPSIPSTNSRPLSKPMVRNPLSCALSSPKNSPTKTQSKPQGLSPGKTASDYSPVKPESPTQIEQSFLGGGGGGDDEHEYYDIPVDESAVDSSLCSSLASLDPTRDPTLRKTKTQNVDVFSNIRKRAASWKAELKLNNAPLSQDTVTAPTPATPTVATPTPTCAITETIRSQPSASPPLALPKTSRKKIRVQKSPPLNAKLPSLSPPSPQASNHPVNTTFTIPFNDAPSFSPNNSHSSSSSTDSPKHKRASKIPLKTLRQSSNSSESSPKEELCLQEELSPLRVITPVETSPINRPNPLARRKLKKLSPPKSISAVNEMIKTSPNTSSSAPTYRPGFSSQKSEPLPEIGSSAKYSGSNFLSNFDATAVILEVPHPEQAFKKAVEALDGDPNAWESKCEALVMLRRIAGCHPEVLIPEMHSVLILMEREVRNQRSQVARSAIACLGDLFAFLGRDMENFLDAIVKTLLMQGAKANNFYKEAVLKTLYEMVTHVSPSKGLTALIYAGQDCASTMVRKLMSQHIYGIIEQHGADRVLRLQRDVLDRTIRTVTQLLGDADAGARFFARASVQYLSLEDEFDAIAEKLLSQKDYATITKTITSINTKGIGKPPLDPPSAKSRRSSLSSSTNASSQLSSSVGHTPKGNSFSAPKPRKSKLLSADVSPVSSDGQVPLPHGLLEKMKDPDFKERLAAITELTDWIHKYPAGLGNNMPKVFDVFNERINDMNSKVNLHALECFESFIPCIGGRIQAVLPTLMEALSRIVAARSTVIHNAALSALDALIDNIDSTIIFAPLAAVTINGNARVQPVMLQIFTSLIPYIYGQKQALAHRVALPVLWKMLERPPATEEAKAALLGLGTALSGCMGSQALQNCASQKNPILQQKLRDLIRLVHQS